VKKPSSAERGDTLSNKTRAGRGAELLAFILIGLLWVGFAYNAASQSVPFTIAITSPTNDANYTAGEAIELAVSFTGRDNLISRVDYVEGTNLLATSASGRFSAVWRHASLGQHAIFARATGGRNLTADSAPIQINVAPANDNFAAATILRGSNISVVGSTVGAISQENWNAGPSAWYSWKSPTNGWVQLDMPDWAYGTYYGAFVGTSVSNLTLIADDLAYDGWFTSFGFPVQAGTNYHIVVTGESPLDKFTLNLNFYPTPPNDDFANRMSIPGHGGTISGNNYTATFESGEPSDGIDPSHRTVWWTWTATAGGKVSFRSLCDFGFLLGCYTGTALSNLTAIAQSVNAGVSLSVLAGTTFQISLDGLGGQSGAFQLETTFNPCPANDNFDRAELIHGVMTRFRGNNTAATFEPGEPIPAGVGDAGSVWFEWVAPVSGYTRLIAMSNEVEQVINVYTGLAVSNLVLVSAADETGTVGFATSKGSTYHIAVDGANGNQGPFMITLAESTLRLTQPSPGAGFYEGQPIVLSAGGQALEEGNSPIEFFANGNLVASAPRQHPVASWTNADFGYYTLTATARDHRGFPQTSQPVDIHVGAKNDDFTNAFALAGLDVSTNGDNYGAGVEPGEPATPDPAANASVWYFWTAPTSGAVSVSIAEDYFSGHTFEVYTGSSISNLTSLGASIYNFYSVDFVGLAGTTYYIEVTGATDNVPNGAGPFTLNLVQTPGPANDFFANRTILSGTSLEVTGSNVNATVEAGEPDAGPSVWWSWTAPATGILSINASGNGLGPVLSFYTGNSISNLQSVAVLSPSWYYGTGTSGEIPVTGGTTYQIRLTGTYDWPMGTVTMNLSFALAPSNDDFASRIQLDSSTLATTNLIGTATEQLGEPDYNFNGQSVWWTWTATNSAQTMLIANATCGAPALGVYTGTLLSNLALVTNGIGSLLFTPTAGETYQIEASQNSCGNLAANVYLALQNGAPANDDFAQRTQLEGTNVAVQGSTMLATSEVGEPAHGGYQGSNSVWWTWTAPANGTVSINVDGDYGFTPTWSFYTGQALNGLSLLADSYEQPFGGISSSAIIPVTAGSAYQIAVDGYSASGGGALGDFTLGLSFNGPPANDDFSNSIPITGPVSTVTGNSVLATEEPGEPPPDGYEGGHSLWWSFTAPASGWLELDANGSSTTTLISVYTGTALDDLTNVAAGNGSFAPIEFYVTAGTTYKISTDYWYPDMSGLVVLNLLFETLEIASPTNGADIYGTAPVNLTANVTDWDGPFTEMDFLVDGAMIGTISNQPYSLVWSNPTLGGHTLQVQLVNSNVVTRISPGNAVAIHPANDNFAQRTIVTGSNLNLDAQGTGATLEPGEPVHGYISYQSVWWSWTAPTSGQVTLSKPSDLTYRFAILDVYTGCSLTDLELVTNTPENDSGTLISTITFEVQAGTAYQIAVAGSFTDVPVTLSFAPGSGNNAALSVQSVSTNGAPMLGQPIRISPTQFAFTLSGTPGSNYMIQASTNLSLSGQDWFTILTTNLSSSPVFFQDDSATTYQRFYRVKTWP